MVNADASFIYFVVLTQLLGVSSVVLARLCEGGPSQRAAQTFLLTSMLALGLITVAALALGTGLGLFCGVGLPLMAVGATLDLRRNPAPVAY